MGRQQASKRYKTKRFTRNIDQILNDDLASKASIQSLKNQKFDEYLPGLGKHYCVPCAKYFESDTALKTHIKSKPHKKQLKAIKFGPYTPEEAAAGAGRDVAKFLATQQRQNNLQTQDGTRDELETVKGVAHRKQKTASGTMDAEDNVMDTPDRQAEEAQASGPAVEDEISI